MPCCCNNSTYVVDQNSHARSSLHGFAGGNSSITQVQRGTVEICVEESKRLNWYPSKSQYTPPNAKPKFPMISVHLHHRTIPSPPNDPLFYTWYFCPWKGLQIPLTLSFKLLTFLVSLLSFSPLALRSSVAFSRISLGSMLRTQMAFSFPQMYLPFMTGWRPGRGEIVTSIWGLARAKSLRWDLRKLLGRSC